MGDEKSTKLGGGSIYDIYGTRGKHVIVDAWGVNSALLNDAELLTQRVREAIEVCGATLVEEPLCHRFDPQGVTVLAMLAESHISLHTYPERGFCAMDVYMCGAADPELAARYLIDAMSPQEVTVQTIERGVSV